MTTRQKLNALSSVREFRAKNARKIEDALFGDGAGNRAITGRSRWYYGRLHGDADRVIQIYSGFSLSTLPEDSPIFVEKTPTGRGGYQFVGADVSIYDYGYVPESETPTFVAGHHEQHERRDGSTGGSDPVEVYARMIVTLRARPQTTPDLTLRVEAGYNPLTGTWLAAHDSPAFAAPAGPGACRYALLYLGDDDADHILYGTTVIGVTPTYPALPNPCAPLAMVYLTNSTTTLTETVILRDPRLLVGGRGLTAADLAATTHAATSKNPPVDADELPLWDSVASGLKKLTWANLKALLDTLYAALSHASRHKHGGADEVATATPAANAIPKAEASGRLNIGFLASGVPDGTKYVRDDGTLVTPAGTGDVIGPAGAIDGNMAVFDGATGKLLKDGGSPIGAPTDAEYIVAAAHASLSAEIIKPYLGDNADPDVYPVSPDALDDEFEGGGALDAKWTKVNDPAGADAMNQTDHTGFLHVGLLELGTDNFDNTVRLHQTPPIGTSTWTIIAKACIVAQGLGGEQAEFSGVILYVADSTNDQFIGADVYLNNVDSAIDTNRAASAADNGAGAFGAMTSDLAIVVAPGDWIYLKLEKYTADAYTSANTYNAYCSKNGLTWYQVGTISKTFTAACDEIGLMFRRPKSQAGTPYCQALVDFFRRTA